MYSHTLLQEKTLLVITIENKIINKFKDINTKKNFKNAKPELTDH